MQVHHLFVNQKRQQGYPVDQRIAIASPPSIVLDAIERYLNARGNVLDLIVPLKDLGKFGTLALDTKVAVEHEPHPNKAMIARYDDRLVFAWSPVGETQPTFTGRFTIRPLGTGTELHLKGEYAPPLGELVSLVPGTSVDGRIAHATIRVLLAELKAIVETEFAMLKDAYALQVRVG